MDRNTKILFNVSLKRMQYDFTIEKVIQVLHYILYHLRNDKNGVSFAKKALKSEYRCHLMHDINI